MEDKCLDCEFSYVDDIYNELVCAKNECVEEWKPIAIADDRVN